MLLFLKYLPANERTNRALERTQVFSSVTKTYGYVYIFRHFLSLSFLCGATRRDATDCIVSDRSEAKRIVALLAFSSYQPGRSTTMKGKEKEHERHLNAKNDLMDEGEKASLYCTALERTEMNQIGKAHEGHFNFTSFRGLRLVEKILHRAHRWTLRCHVPGKVDCLLRSEGLGS